MKFCDTFKQPTLADHKSNYGRLLSNYRLTGLSIDRQFYAALEEGLNDDTAWFNLSQTKRKGRGQLQKATQWMVSRSIKQLNDNHQYKARIEVVRILHFLNTMADWKTKASIEGMEHYTSLSARNPMTGRTDQAVVAALLTLYHAHGKDFTISTRELTRYSKVTQQVQHQSLLMLEELQILTIHRPKGAQDGIITIGEYEPPNTLHRYTLNIHRLAHLLVHLVRAEAYELFGCSKEVSVRAFRECWDTLQIHGKFTSEFTLTLPQNPIDACFFLRIEMNRIEDFLRNGERKTAGLFKLYNPDVCTHGSGFTFTTLFLIASGVYKAAAIQRVVGGSRTQITKELNTVFGALPMLKTKDIIMWGTMALSPETKYRLMLSQNLRSLITKFPKSIYRMLQVDERIEWAQVEFKSTLGPKDEFGLPVGAPKNRTAYPRTERVNIERPLCDKPATARHIPEGHWAYLKKNYYTPTRMGGGYHSTSLSWPPERARKKEHEKAQRYKAMDIPTRARWKEKRRKQLQEEKARIEFEAEAKANNMTPEEWKKELVFRLVAAEMENEPLW